MSNELEKITVHLAERRKYIGAVSLAEEQCVEALVATGDFKAVEEVVLFLRDIVCEAKIARLDTQ